jgi:polysaccharide biosynthesis protein PslG
MRKHPVNASRVVLAFALGISLVGWMWETRDPFYGWAVKDPPFTSLTYAYHAFLWWNPQDTVHLSWARQGNFSHVKQIFAWADIQPWHDQWVWERADEVVALAEGMGVQLVARLSDAPDWAHPGVEGEKDDDFHDAPPTDPADFGTFCGRVAERYRGRIDAYQVWNEPNLSREWGSQQPDAAAYVQLLAACSTAIRAADPDAIVISAGLSPTGTHNELAHRDDLYLQAMYDAGFQQYVDVVGVHAPGFSSVEYGPDDAERDGKGRWATFRRVEDMRRIMVANNDAQRQMAILEMGWTVADERHPEYAWFAVSEEEQAEQLAKAYAYAAEHWRPWMGLMVTIYLADPSWTEDDEELFFAITLPNMAGRAALSPLQNMAKYCGDRVIPARDPASPEALGFVPTDPCD